MAINYNTTIKKEFTGGSPGHVQNAKYFYFDRPHDKNSELNIFCGGYEQCASNFKIDRTSFPFFGFIFISGGKGSFTINDTYYPLSYGSLIAFSPNKPHKFDADVDVPMEQFFLIFKGSRAMELLEKSKMEQKNAVKVCDPEALLSSFQKILRIGLNQTEYANEICCNYLKAILLEQVDQRHNKYIESTSFENFQRCKDYLENNFISIYTSSQLADECSINIRYLARLFRKYENSRPYEYLMNLKMNKAANLFLTTSFNVNQVAKMTGIEDPYHFSRIFKKKFKIAPSKYRESFY